MSAPHRTITLVAWLNVAVHVLALVMAAWKMRPGTPLVPLGDRLAYLADSPLGWQLGWGAWMLCTPFVIAFFALAAERVQTGLARLAAIVAVVAVGIDLSCDVVFIIAFPLVAAMTPVPESLFLTLERATGAVSLIVANGFYTIAVLLLNSALCCRAGFSRWTSAVGYGVVVFGFLLAAAGFTGVPWHAEWATGPTLVLYCLWIVLVARSLGSAEAPS